MASLSPGHPGPARQRAGEGQAGQYALGAALVLRHMRDGIALPATDAPGTTRFGGPARLPAGMP